MQKRGKRRQLLIIVQKERRAGTMWKFYKLTNVTILGSLLKNIRIGCKNNLSSEPLSENHKVNCLTFDINTRQPYKYNCCLLRKIALQTHGIDSLEEENWNI